MTSEEADRFIDTLADYLDARRYSMEALDSQSSVAHDLAATRLRELLVEAMVPVMTGGPR
jgi:hypothetical protein